MTKPRRIWWVKKFCQKLERRRSQRYRPILRLPTRHLPDQAIDTMSVVRR